MSLPTRPLSMSRFETTREKWARRRDIPIAILAWIAVAAIVFWGAGHIIRSLLLLIIAALLAYALAPAVGFLQRFMPRFLAILIVYLVVLGAVSLLLYFIVSTAIQQISSLTVTVQQLLTPSSKGQVSPLEQTIQSFGITEEQIQVARDQIISRAETLTGSIVPILTRAFDVVLDIILVAVLSIYLLIDGAHVSNWLRRNAPQAVQADSTLDTVQRIVGGYIRGQVLLATLVGVLVGVGMFLFHVPYAVLLGVLAFVMAFIPVIGTFISGAICVVAAFSQGWIIAVLVLAYFIGVHIIEGDVVGPRIVGQAVGIHPVVSLVALIAGSELFGIWGALFASPLAGVLQALLVALWTQWRQQHPEQFDEIEEEVIEKIE